MALFHRAVAQIFVLEPNGRLCLGFQRTHLATGDEGSTIRVPLLQRLSRSPGSKLKVKSFSFLTAKFGHYYTRLSRTYLITQQVLEECCCGCTNSWQCYPGIVGLVPAWLTLFFSRKLASRMAFKSVQLGEGVGFDCCLIRLGSDVNQRQDNF